MAVGWDRALGGVITSSNHVIEPGVIRNVSPDRNTLWVGELDDRQTPRIEALRRVLIGAGIASPSTADIRYDVWHKLMANLCGSTLCQITGLAIPIQKTPLMNRLVRRAHAEALAVAAAHGIVLDDSPDVRYGPRRVYPDHRPSILQDYELGRPMEVEAIVRAPLAFARAARLDTPVLDSIESLSTTMAEARGLYAS
jgi:2-dehydropantoate 2-reductase